MSQSNRRFRQGISKDDILNRILKEIESLLTPTSTFMGGNKYQLRE